jgi:p-cumate 2,3-dioxygenase beta subunit
MAEAITQRTVEEFLFEEADMLDEWRLHDWVGLFARQCRYLVPSTDVPGDSAPEETLFYVADDRHRLEQRVIRLMKKTAHAEYPRSRTLHMISNVRLRGETEGDTLATSNFATYRTNRSVTDTYIGQHRYRLTLEDGEMRIKEKRTVLALDGLRPHGRISMIV